MLSLSRGVFVIKRWSLEIIYNVSSDYPDRSSKGVFFIIPCVDVYEKIDMRTATYEIPPQEVGYDYFAIIMMMIIIMKNKMLIAMGFDYIDNGDVAENRNIRDPSPGGGLWLFCYQNDDDDDDDDEEYDVDSDGLWLF